MARGSGKDSESKGTSKAEGYAQAAASMAAAGIGTVSGKSTSGTSAGPGRGSSPGGPSISASAGPGRGSSPGGPSISASPGIGGSGRADVGLSVAANGVAVAPTGITVAPGTAPAPSSRAQEYSRAANSMTRAGVMGLSGTKNFNPITGKYTGKAGPAAEAVKAAVIGANSSKAEIESYIRGAARARGIDEDTAVKVWGAEGKNAKPEDAWQSNVTKNGRREPSYGPFQMLSGGKGTGFPKGLGNDFERDTGLSVRDPNTVQAQIDYALNHAAQKGWGAWYGANAVGISKWDGLGNAKTVPLGSYEVAAMPQSMTAPGSRPGATISMVSAEGRAGARSDSADRFAQTYLAGAAPDTTNMTPEDYFGPSASIPTAKAAPAQPERPSRGRQIAGTIIDGAVGAIPGVGLFAAGANALARATGNKTIGDRVTGLFADGEFGKYPLNDSPPEGNDYGWQNKSYAEMTTEEREDRFEAVYLSGFDDDTARPTPAEKWGRRSDYGAREYA